MIFIKFKRFLIFLFIALLFANISLAYTIEKMNINCNVNPDNTVNETITLTIYNNDNKNLTKISYSIPQSIENLTINASKDIRGYSSMYEGGVTEVEVDFEKPIQPKEQVNVTFNFIVRDAVWERNDIKQLILSFPISAKNATIKIVLPPGAVIASYQNSPLITPSGYKITTDGTHQIIIWNLALNKGITFTAIVKYTFATYPAQNVIEYPSTKKYQYAIIILAIFGAVITGLFIREMINKKKIINKINNEKENINKELDKLKNTLEEKEYEINKLNEKIKKLEEELNTSKRNILNKNEIISVLNERISEYESTIQNLREKNNTYKETIESVNKTVEKLKKENEELKNKVNSLEEIAKKYVEEKKGMLWSFLTDEEKTIIDLIKKHGNITQKEIVEITGMSKPKVSRILSELEDRKIIKKEKIGRVNTLALTDESKKFL